MGVPFQRQVAEVFERLISAPSRDIAGEDEPAQRMRHLYVE